MGDVQCWDLPIVGIAQIAQFQQGFLFHKNFLSSSHTAAKHARYPPHGRHLHRRDRFCFGPECQTSVITPGHHGVICIACLPEGGDQKVGHGFAKGLHRLPPAPVSQSGLGSHVHLMCGLRQGGR